VLEQHTFDYAIIRVVPHEERGEFINSGVILFCRAVKFLRARVTFDSNRLLAIAPGIDLEMVQQHLQLIPLLCAGGSESGPIGQLPLAERFRWIVSPRNTIIQTSSPHSGLCSDPAAMLDHLLETMVR
jgi:hypothetical protein